jgi:hypothetical protein
MLDRFNRLSVGNRIVVRGKNSKVAHKFLLGTIVQVTTQYVYVEMDATGGTRKFKREQLLYAA